MVKYSLVETGIDTHIRYVIAGRKFHIISLLEFDIDQTIHTKVFIKEEFTIG